MTAIIEVNQLRRNFGPIEAIDDLTFSVNEGEVFGLLGPNGAGKTTSIRILNGVLAPSGGTTRVLNMDPMTHGTHIRKNTGVLTETPSLYERLSARDNLLTFGALYEIAEDRLGDQVESALNQFGLQERGDDKVGTFSKGMKQRLALARAFLHEPQILFLDEPSAGLDPEAARQVTELIEQISHQGRRTVFLCTHNLDEAQKLCDRVALINKGKLLALGTLEELSQILWKTNRVDIQCDQEPDPVEMNRLEQIAFVRDVVISDRMISFEVSDIHKLPDAVALLASRGVRILQVMLRKHTLEEIYFAYQQDEVKDEHA